MNVRTIIISTICMISSCAYAMEESFDARIAAFRAKNPQKVVIINGFLYKDPLSPAALAARAAFNQRRQQEHERQLEEQRQACIRQNEAAAHEQEKQDIANRAMQGLPANAEFDMNFDLRSQASSSSANKENPSSVYR